MHDGRGERQLNPVRQGLVDPAVTADEVAAHFQNDGRQRQHEADPEAARHVGEFGIGRRIEACHLGLQRHAADRAAAGTDLADLRMHRAGIDRALRRGGFRLALVEILPWDRRRIWFGSRPSRNDRFRRGSRTDAGWSRDRPSFRRRGRARSPCAAVMVTMMGVIVTTAAAAGLRRFRGKPGRRLGRAAAAGTLCSAACAFVFGFGHRVLHRHLQPIPSRGI